MFKKTAIALSLAMVAGTGVAAQGNAGMSNSNGTGGHADVDASVVSEFRSLDRNGDGVISRSEAAQNPTLAEVYDSFDTSATMEADARQNGPTGGITLDQYAAGMQAAHSNAGVVGDSVSGGETYIMMKDGSRKLKDNASSSSQPMGNGASNRQERATGAMSSSSDRMPQQSQRMQERGEATSSTMGSDRYESARSAGDDARMQSGSDDRMKATQGEANY